MEIRYFVGQKLCRIGYEWKTILALFAIIVGAAVSILILGSIKVYGLTLYAIKLVFILLFISIGMKAAIIITRRSPEKVFNAFSIKRGCKYV